MLTPERLAELRALAEKATPGKREWFTNENGVPIVSSKRFAIIGPTESFQDEFAHIAAFDRETSLALIAAAERTAELEAERDAGARFKEFVHAYLTQHGVPEGDPNNHHQIEGCRIGARLDLLFAECYRLKESLSYCLRHIKSTVGILTWEDEKARAALAKEPTQ